MDICTKNYRQALVIAVIGVVLLAWLSLGVGIIGRDGDPANVLYFGVIALGCIGALIARFQARGMAGALVVMALAQALIGAYAIISGLGYPYSGALELAMLNGFFIVLFLASAWLFRCASQTV